MTVTIRPATTHDLDAIFTCHKATYIDTYGEFFHEGNPSDLFDEQKEMRKEKYQSNIDNPNGRILVATVDNDAGEEETVGFYIANWEDSTEEDPKAIYLDEMFVHPEFQGQGIGKKLWISGIHSTPESVQRIHFDTVEGTNSVHFYKKRGAKMSGDPYEITNQWRTLTRVNFEYVVDIDTDRA